MPKRPHLILILTDQQRGDCLGLDGHPVLSTPNLDDIGGQGAICRRAYSEVPSCIPARRILLTGTDQVSNGMVGYQNDPGFEPPHTLPGELGRAGYQTHLIGKLHFQPNRRRFGFDSMAWSDAPHLLYPEDPVPCDYGRFLQRHGRTLVDESCAHGVDPNSWIARPSHLEERLSFSNWCVDEAIEFVQRRDPTVPFFLNVSFQAPHPPLTPPQLYYDRYMDLELPPAAVGDWVDTAGIPATGPGGPSTEAARIRLDPQTLRRCRAAYYGLINHVDDQIGRLVQFLQRVGLWNDCFVLFTADHGEMLGDHHLFRKTYAYEGSARVPFLVRPPPWMGLAPHQSIARPVGLQDVTPTLLEAAGVPIPSAVDGRSVLPLMRGETTWREHLHGEHAPCYRREDGMQFLTDGAEKYIWYTQTGQEQLFALDQDPLECRDLARSPMHAERLARWRARLLAQLAGRPEGFVDGGRLVAGRPQAALLPR